LLSDSQRSDKNDFESESHRTPVSASQVEVDVKDDSPHSDEEEEKDKRTFKETFQLWLK